MYQISKALLLFAFFTPIFSYTIRDTLHHNLSKLPRAVPERPLEQPHIAPEVPAGRPRPEQPVPATEQIEDLIASAKIPSWMDYGEDAGNTEAIKQLHLVSEKGTKPVSLYEVNEDGKLRSKQPVNLLEELQKLQEKPDSNGKIFRIADPTEVMQIDPSDGWKVTKVDIGWNVRYFSPKDAIEIQLAEFDDRERSRQWRNQRAGTWWARAAKRSNVLTTIAHNVDSAGTNSTTAQDLADEFQLYLYTLYAIEAKISDLVAPVLNKITAQTNSTFIHNMAQSVLYDITGSTTILAGPFNFGMSFVGNLTNTTSSLTSDNGPTNSTVSQNSNGTDSTAILTAMENIYTAMWIEAMTAANSTGLLPRHALFLEYLSSNNTALYPPGFETVAGGHGNSTQTKT